MNQRIIQITGEGKKAYRPDRIEISFDFKEVLEDYDDAIEAAAYYTEEVKRLSVDAGIKKEAVQTTVFSISPKYEYRKDEKGRQYNKFVGYGVKQSYSIKIAMDNDLLSRLIFALRELKGEIRFRYCLENRKAAEEEVLALAVEDASRQAKLLANAAGQRLGDIISIDHSYSRIEFGYNERNDYEVEDVCCMKTAPRFDINPADLIVRDTVNITWSFE